MKLRTVTCIVITGLCVALIVNLVNFPWRMISRNIQLVFSLVSMGCMYGALLFFFIHLYLRGGK